MRILTRLVKSARGYKLFTAIIIIILTMSAIILALEDATKVAESHKDGSRTSGIEHRSKDWYEAHKESDGRKIPLNTSNTGIYIEKLYSLMDINLLEMALNTHDSVLFYSY